MRALKVLKNIKGYKKPHDEWTIRTFCTNNDRTSRRNHKRLQIHKDFYEFKQRRRYHFLKKIEIKLARLALFLALFVQFLLATRREATIERF